MDTEKILWQGENYVITPRSLQNIELFISDEKIPIIPLDDKNFNLDEIVIQYFFEIDDENNSVFLSGGYCGIKGLEGKVKIDDCSTFEKLRGFVDKNTRGLYGETENLNSLVAEAKEEINQIIKRQALKEKLFLSNLELKGIGVFKDAESDFCVNICDGINISDCNKKIEVKNLVELIPRGKIKPSLQFEFFPSNEDFPPLVFQQLNFFLSPPCFIDLNYFLSAEKIYINSKQNDLQLKRLCDFENVEDYKNYWTNFMQSQKVQGIKIFSNLIL